MYRTISFNFSNIEEVEQFLDYISKYVKIEYYAIVREKNVYIQLSGPPHEIKRAIAVMKTAAGLARARLRPLRAYPIDLLFKETETAAPVPPDTIADYLSILGFKAKLKGDSLLTDAAPDAVRKAVEDISKAYKALEAEAVTPHAKRIVAVYMAARGAPPGRAVEELAEAGVLNKGDVYSLAADLQTAKKKLRALAAKLYRPRARAGRDVAGGGEARG
ncbi:MAG: DUF2067 domain-containing protein [Thermoproteus sp. AZ2]|jgi:hypothetical protein|uniref:DUF2067 domain-containing protein n=1 Tax=Thermoproteus sp. AZ2 TaxID=1609232 RepID=A0ACC6V117_9CREN